jgi:hypothetical protein
MRRVGWSAIVVFSSLGLAGCLQILGDFSIESGLDDDASMNDATVDTGTSSESGVDAGGTHDATVEAGAGGGDGAADAETGADAEVDGDAQTVAEGQADAVGEADAEAEADAGLDAEADVAVCDSATHLANACGGCSTLAHDAGSACTLTDGGCPGTYVCVAGDADAVLCNAPKTNACGGCTTLAEEAGSRCETACDSGTWVCQDKTALICSAHPDPCGGCAVPSGGSTACVTDLACLIPQGSCNSTGTCSYTQLANCDGG